MSRLQRIFKKCFNHSDSRVIVESIGTGEEKQLSPLPATIAGLSGYVYKSTTYSGMVLVVAKTSGSGDYGTIKACNVEDGTIDTTPFGSGQTAQLLGLIEPNVYDLETKN